MCGRYTYNLQWRQIVRLYRLTLPEEPPKDSQGRELGPNYNVAPTHVMPIIRPAGNGRELIMAGWGLIPFWMKAENLGKNAYSTINARAETIQTAASYREPFKKRRCVVPATGWYEWQKINTKTKKPHHFRLKDHIFGFAGVYDVWNGDGGKSITSFSIVTTDTAPALKKYHDRMPVILDDSQFDDWMRGPPELAAEMMKPCPHEVEAWEVASDVGNVRNNRPDLMERAAFL